MRRRRKTRQLRFDTKETTDQINFFAVDDRLDDEGESLTLCLGDLPEPYAVLVGLDCATINIIDNDDPNRVKVSFYSGNYYASEDGNPAWPRVTVHPVPDREITIPITSTRGGRLSAADHSTVTTSVTFGPDVRGGRLLTDNISYACLSIEIWDLDDDEDDDGEYMDLAFGPMPDRFVSGETGYHLCGDKREGFRRPANQPRVWFQDNEFTVVPVSNPPNRQVPRMVWASFLDAELEASEGNFENGRLTTVRVRLSRHRDIARTVTIPITLTPHGGATPGVDYVVTDILSQLTFKPGQTEQSFRVAAINDDDEYLTIGFGTPLPERVLTGSTTTTRINVVDDDVPAVEISFAQSSYQVTSITRNERIVSAKIDVTVRLSANPERFVNMGIVAESIRGDGGIYFGYSAYIPRGPTSGAAFYESETEFTLTVVIWAWEEFDPDQTYRLSFGGLPHRVSAGNPATATITVNANT